eukprot:TRINITY_DN3313_c0_g3_i1.p1 TRINITY_DN3313_c0_g3~~TRINITY_DN3313_c0_g3_i1.p1  ORF type:complete len:998 (+),score=209.08 TRINITY_DN3313_c0_g3_i1:391-3384(+)
MFQRFVKKHDDSIVRSILCFNLANQIFILLTVFFSFRISLLLTITYVFAFFFFNKNLFFNIIVQNMTFVFFYFISSSPVYDFVFEDLYWHFVDSFMTTTYILSVLLFQMNLSYSGLVGLQFLFNPIFYKLFGLRFVFRYDHACIFVYFGVALRYFQNHWQSRMVTDRRVIEENQRLLEFFFEILLKLMSSYDKAILTLFAGQNENYKSCTKVNKENKENDVDIDPSMEKTLDLLGRKFVCTVKNGILAVIHFGTVDNDRFCLENDQNKCFHLISNLVEQNGFLSTFFAGSQIIIVKNPYCDYNEQQSQSFEDYISINEYNCEDIEKNCSNVHQSIWLEKNAVGSGKGCEFDHEILEVMLGLIAAIIPITPKTILFKVSIHCGDFAFTFYGNTKSSFSVTGKVIDEAISMLSFCDFGQIIFPSTINECVSWFEGYQLELVQNKMKHAHYVYYMSDISLYQEIMKDHLIDLQTSKMIVVEMDMVSNWFDEYQNIQDLKGVDEFFSLSSTVIEQFTQSSKVEKDPLTQYLKGTSAYKTHKYNEIACTQLNFLQTAGLIVNIVFFVLNDKIIVEIVYFYSFCFVISILHVFITSKVFRKFSKIVDNTLQMLVAFFVPLMILLKGMNMDQLEVSYAAAVIGSFIITYKQAVFSVIHENKLSISNIFYLLVFTIISILLVFVFIVFYYPLKIHMLYSVPSFCCFFYAIVDLSLNVQDHFTKLKEQQTHMQAIEKKIYSYIPKSLFLNCLFQPLIQYKPKYNKCFNNAILFVVHLKIVQDSQSQGSLESVETIDFNVQSMIDNEVSRYKSIICFGNHGNTWFFCSIFENFVDGEFIATYKNPRLNELIPFFQIYEVLKFQFLLRDNLKEKYDSGIKFASINCVSKIQLSVFFNTNIAALFHSNGWNDCLQLLFLSDSNGIFVTEELSFFYKKILVLLRAYHVGSSFKVDAKDKLRFTNFFKNFGVSTDIFTSNYGFKFADESTIHYRNTSRKIFEAYLGKKSCL